MRGLQIHRMALCVAFLVCLPLPAAALIAIGAFDVPENAFNAVEVVGDLAYVTDQDFGLRIIDVSEPEAPIEVGTFRASRSTDLQVVGSLAYMVTGGSRIEIINVSDPAGPTELNLLQFLGYVSSFEVVDDLVYAAIRSYSSSGTSEIQVIDVSDPLAPVPVGALDVTGIAYGITVSDGLAYVSIDQFISPTESGEIRILDISDPRALVEVGAIETRTKGRGDVEVVERIAYVTSGPNLADMLLGDDPSPVFQVIDVSSPSAPVERSALVTPESIYQVKVSDGYAYLSTFSGLQVVDVTDTASPVLLGELDVAGRDMEVLNGLAYVARGSAGLWIVDVSNPMVPDNIDSISPPDDASDVTVLDGLAYVAGGASGLQIIDIADPNALSLVSVLDTPGLVLDVELENGFAYLADVYAGVRIVDVSDPGSPVELGAIDTPDRPRNLAVADGIVYAAAGDGGLRIIDASNPAAPVEIGGLATPAYAYDVEVAGGYAYLSVIYFGQRPPGIGSSLWVVDISDPTSPLEVGALDFNANATGMEMADGLLYLAGSGGLRVIDVSNPSAPLELGFIETAAGSSDVDYVDGLAFVANGEAGVRVIDVSDPEALFEVGGWRTSAYGRAVDVKVVDGVAFIAYIPGFPGKGGLLSVDFGPEYQPALSVEAIVKSGAETGVINPRSRGVVPVAILGSEDFDIEEIDQATLAFGSFDVPPAFVAAGGNRDVNRDGYPDLTVQFRISESGIGFGDTEVCLRGALFEGRRFRACAALRTVPGR